MSEVTNRVGIVVLADTENHENMGRIANALELAKECKEAGDHIKIIFDGGGTTWVPQLEDENNQLHPLYKEVKDKVVGACDFCAGAFHVKNDIKKTDVPLLAEYDNHPSLRQLINEGCSIVTF